MFREGAKQGKTAHLWKQEKFKSIIIEVKSRREYQLEKES